MTTYTDLDRQLTGRCRTRRKVGNNTYAERRGFDIAIRLHDTDVVTFHADDSFTINDGGYRTYTTKERINTFAPVRLWQDDGRWYVSKDGRTHVYADGITFHRDGTVTGGQDITEAAREDAERAKLRRQIRAFVGSITAEQIVSAWENTGGDCFMCRWEGVGGSTDHLHLHVEEGYFHASLAFLAVKAKGYRSPEAIMGAIYHDAQRGKVSDLLTKALGSYLRKNMITTHVSG